MFYFYIVWVGWRLKFKSDRNYSRQCVCVLCTEEFDLIITMQLVSLFWAPKALLIKKKYLTLSCVATVG